MDRVRISKIIPYLVLFVTAVLIVINMGFSGAWLKRDTELTRTTTATMYADSYAETGAYPDLFLRNLVRDKEVTVAREIKTYDDYSTFGRDEEEGNPFDKQYLIENDYSRWFSLYAGSLKVDTSLPAGKDVEGFMERFKGDFENIGEANDMLRYSFALNREKVQQASAFWYSWYYNTFSEKQVKEKGKDMLPNIYVNLNDIDKSSSFIAVWTNKEDLYLMTEDKYREYLTGDEQ